MTQKEKEMILSELLFNRDERLLKYINNSEQTIELLRIENKKLQQENNKLRSELERNNTVPIKKYNKLKLEKEELELRLFSIKDYKLRIDKAIEYITSLEYFEINNSMTGSFVEDTENYLKAHNKLLDILRGEE